jgi:uncharacterized RDD family membrane protein YckC
MTDRDLQQRRYIAAGIDIAVVIAIGIVFAIASVILGVAFTSASSTSMIGVYLPKVVSFLGSLVTLAYILGRDLVAGDRSIGKKIQNIRVVTVTGTPIGPTESMKRNGIFAIGAALSALSATLGLIPFVGDFINCLLIPVMFLGLLVGLAAGIYELILITQRPDGVRYGDQLAGTRVVR